jgi:hypothetical protein
MTKDSFRIMHQNDNIRFRDSKFKKPDGAMLENVMAHFAPFIDSKKLDVWAGFSKVSVLLFHLVFNNT